MFFLIRTSEDLDQSASELKSLVTTLDALPNEKSLSDAVILLPIQIAEEVSVAAVSAVTVFGIILSL